MEERTDKNSCQKNSNDSYFESFNINMTDEENFGDMPRVFKLRRNNIKAKKELFDDTQFQ